MGYENRPCRDAALKDARLLRYSVAFLWLATGLGVLHESYRSIGHDYLSRLGLPDSIMFATCAGEIVLGLWVAAGHAGTLVTVLQVGLIAGFSGILTWLEPRLWVHCYGLLTKNLPLLAVIITAWLLEREGWSQRAFWLLRAGMALIWITEGLFPKILFQSQMECEVVANSGLVSADPGKFLVFMGVCQAASGVAALLLHTWPLRIVLACQIAGLVLLPVLVSWQDPLLWVHPFGPLTKNVPIIVGTVVVLRRTSLLSLRSPR